MEWLFCSGGWGERNLPGWNDIVIPMTDILYGPQGRRMDLTQIRGFGVFVTRQTDRRVLYLDNVRLF